MPATRKGVWQQVNLPEMVKSSGPLAIQQMAFEPWFVIRQDALNCGVCRLSSCQAATASRQPLATYKWPEARPDVLQWMEHAIQHAVQRLDKAPFLELVYHSRHDTHCSIYPVDESVVDSPQVCCSVHRALLQLTKLTICCVTEVMTRIAILYAAV